MRGIEAKLLSGYLKNMIYNILGSKRIFSYSLNNSLSSDKILRASSTLGHKGLGKEVPLPMSVGAVWFNTKVFKLGESSKISFHTTI